MDSLFREYQRFTGPRGMPARLALAVSLFALLQCERQYYNVQDGKDLPAFESTEAGTVSETSWLVTAQAPDWGLVDRYDVKVSFDDLLWPPDTGQLETGAAFSDSSQPDTAVPTEGATTRITITLEDGTQSTLDYSHADPTNGATYLNLPLCPETSCTTVVHVRIETLTAGLVMAEASLSGALTVPPGCMNMPREEDVAGMAISIEPLIEE